MFASFTALPSTGLLPPMIVCLCHRVSERDIAREAAAGCGSFEQLQDQLRVGTACGACTDCAREAFDAHASPQACPGHLARRMLVMVTA
jgi:bacterioferritin-associated ferredoxin